MARLPRGVAAALATAVAALPVFGFDEGERLAEQWFGIDGGPGALLVVVLAFVACWLADVILLAAFAPRPSEEGLWAGLAVAGLMALLLLPTAIADDLGLLFPLAFFGALAIGLGALSGGLAQKWRGGNVSRRGSWFVLYLGSVFTIAVGILAGPLGLGFDAITWVVWGFCALFVLGGWLGLRSTRRAPPAPPAGST